MNMSQSFFRRVGEAEGVEYLQKQVQGHAAWGQAPYWGDSLLLSIGEEMSKAPSATP